MISTLDSKAYQRVLIGLGGAPVGEPAIRTAIVLASALRTGIAGLFVEEQALHDFSALPFARAVRLGKDGVCAVTPASMQAALKQRATDCRRLIEVHASRAGLSWTFEQVRGAWPNAIRAATGSGDIVLVQNETATARTGSHLAMLRSVAPATGAVAVAAASSGRPAGPVLAIDDGDGRGRQTVLLAARIAEAANAPLALLIVASSENAARGTEARAQSLIRDSIPISVHWIVGGALPAIGAVLRDMTPRFVVADLEGEPFSDDTSAAYLIRQAGAPVILLA